MRKIVIILSVFALVSQNIYSQNKKYEAEKTAITDFLIRHIDFYYVDLSAREAADELNAFAKKVFAKQYTADQIPDLITQALQLLYQNSVGMFEDTPHTIYATTMRSICFLALAFLTDELRYPTFLTDARNTLSNIEFANGRMLLIVNLVELYRELSHEFVVKRYIERLISQYQDDLKNREKYIHDEIFIAEYREILSNIAKSLR